MANKSKQEMRAKRSELIKALRLTHNKLISGEHSRHTADILNGLIFLFELREKERHK